MLVQVALILFFHVKEAQGCVQVTLYTWPGVAGVFWPEATQAA